MRARKQCQLLRRAAMLLLALGICLSSTTALSARGGGRVRVLFDFEGDFNPSQLGANDAQADLVKVATGHALRVRTGQGIEWPGVTFYPRQGRWDISGYRYLKMDIKNTGVSGAIIGFVVKSPDGSGDMERVSASARVAPGATEVLAADLSSKSVVADRTVDFLWMRGTPQPRLDTSNVVQLMLYVVQPDEPHEFIVDDVRLETPTEALAEEAFFPLVDGFGQFAHEDWPGKTHSVEDLARRRAMGEADLLAHPGPEGWDRYGGWAAGPQLEATGFFRVEKYNGKWWFVDPEGRLFWSHGFNTVSHLAGGFITARERYFHGLPDPESPLAAFYYTKQEYLPGSETLSRFTGFHFGGANLYRKYGADWKGMSADVVHRRLRSWGANTIAGFSSGQIYNQSRTPYVVAFPIQCKRIEEAKGYWREFPDVFDPSFRNNLRYQLKTEYGRALADPWCIGFLTDDEMSWEDEVYLATATITSTHTQPAKQVFVADLQAKYGHIARLNASWGSDYDSWQDLLHSQEEPDRQRAWQDLVAFNAKIIETYFKTVRETLREVAPNHLYLCSQFGFSGGLGNEQSARFAVKYCDVVASNRFTRSGVEHFRVPGGVDHPILISSFLFEAVDRGPFWTGLVRAEDQEQRAALYESYVRGALRNPYIVGAHWYKYGDDATMGAGGDSHEASGQNAQRGFVDVCDTPYPEMVAASRAVGYTLYEYRLGSRRLTVAKVGAGSGTVTSEPAGIDCGSGCSSTFAHNTVITLTATPDAGSTFVGWRGGGLGPACSNAGDCAVTMDTVKYVVAAFEAKPAYPVYLPLVLRSS